MQYKTDIMINLSPNQRTKHPIFIRFFLIIPCILSTLWLCNGYLSQLNKTQQIYSAKIKHLEDERSTHQELLDKQKKLARRIEFFSQLETKQAKFICFLQELANLASDNIVFLHLERNSRRICLDAAASSHNYLFEFIERIKSRNYFRDIALKQVRIDGNEEKEQFYQFSFTFAE